MTRSRSRPGDVRGARVGRQASRQLLAADQRVREVETRPGLVQPAAQLHPQFREVARRRRDVAFGDLPAPLDALACRSTHDIRSPLSRRPGKPPPGLFL
jgi:hypothetical protein